MAMALRHYGYWPIDYCYFIGVTGFRLLSNYEICDGALLACNDVIQESNQVKENVSGGVPLASRKSLGLAVKELWKEKVKLVKRGQRGNQKHFYLNLRKKPNQPQSICSLNDSFVSLFSHDELPVNWTSIIDHNKKINFIRLENCAYQKNRVKTELSVTKTASGEFLYTISCRGQEIEFKNLIDINTIAQQPIKERVLTILTLLDQSTMCEGVPFDQDATMKLSRYEHGIYSDLSNADSSSKEEYRGFSSNCKVIVSHGRCCVSCSRFFHGVIWRKSNEVKNTVIHPNTPKCYMSKSDIVVQLEKEKQRRINVEAREKYWRDKFDQ